MNDITYLIFLVGGSLALAVFLWLERRSLFPGVSLRSSSRLRRSSVRVVRVRSVNAFKPRSALPAAELPTPERSMQVECSEKIVLSSGELSRLVRAAVLYSGGVSKELALTQAFDNYVYSLDGKQYKVVKGGGAGWKRYAPLFDVAVKPDAKQPATIK